MNIIDKIKKENYNKYKNNKTIMIELQDWLIEHTTIDLTELSKQEMIFLIRNNYTENPKCTCGKKIKFKYNKYRKYCSTKCAGSNSVTKEKRKHTVNEKYGCDNVFQNADIRKEIQKTYLKNWGAESYMQSTRGKRDYENKMMKKYGVINSFQLEHVKQTNSKRWNANKDTIIPRIINGRKKTYLEKLDRRGISHGFTRDFNLENYHGCGRKYKYPFTCTKCSTQFTHHLDDGTIPACPFCFPNLIANGSSIIERSILKYISSITTTHVTTNDRTKLYPLEIDILVNNIGIELDGLYWHSENAGKKSKNYHLNKTHNAAKEGLILIHIFEDEWRYKQPIVKNRLRHILNESKYTIYARKCEIKEIDGNLKNKFLNKYHIQGADKSSIKLGAFYKNRLIGVMTFGKRRFDKKDGYELIRYATIGHFSCVGVAGKLLKHFERNWNPTAIISYADLRWSTGNLYTKLGFTHSHTSTPNYFYMEDYNQRINRIAFQKHKLKDKLKLFDPNLSEWGNMKANGYDRIWDCGNMVFEKTY